MEIARIRKLVILEPISIFNQNSGCGSPNPKIGKIHLTDYTVTI